MSVDLWSSPLHPSAHVVARRLEDTFFLMNLHTNAFFELNATGTEIWSWLEKNQTLAGCFEYLVGKFDVDPAQLREQVEVLVRELIGEGLLALETGEAGANALQSGRST